MKEFYYNLFQVYPVLTVLGTLFIGGGALIASLATLNLIGTILYYKILLHFFKGDAEKLLMKINNKGK